MGYFSDETTCPKGEDGRVDLARDCMIRRVGDATLHISISMPVAEHLQHPLGWAFTHGIELGTLNKLQNQFKSESWAAKTACPPLTKVDESQAIALTDFLGLFVIASTCVLGGCLLALASMIRKSRASGAGDTEAEDTKVEDTNITPCMSQSNAGAHGAGDTEAEDTNICRTFSQQTGVISTSKGDDTIGQSEYVEMAAMRSHASLRSLIV